MPHSSPHRFRLSAATGLVTAFVLLASGIVAADPDAEHEALARLIHEIDALAPLVDEAAAQASPDTRVRFRYDWLRQDLLRVRTGIREHLDAPRNEPRRFPPLRGDYRQ
jgi:RAQPRD family integrative conjugative element protein